MIGSPPCEPDRLGTAVETGDPHIELIRIWNFPVWSGACRISVIIN